MQINSEPSIPSSVLPNCTYAFFANGALLEENKLKMEKLTEIWIEWCSY